MVSIIIREVNGKKKYYLSHSYRKKNKILHIEKFLGNQKPNYEELSNNIKEEFNYEVFEKRWLSNVKQIISNFQKDFNSRPKPIQIKDLRTFGVRFTHNTNRIEGSTLKLRDVSLIIEDDITPKNKIASDVIEAKSHMNVYEEMITCNKEVSLNLLLHWHKKIFELTKPNIAGLFRNYPIQISRSKYVPPIGGVKELLSDLLDWYRVNKEKLHPIYLACYMHYHFVSIHPFGDGNGRMCRILMNYILFQNKCPMFDIEYKIRNSYYNALEKSNLKEDTLIFIQWFMSRYIKSNLQYI